MFYKKILGRKCRYNFKIHRHRNTQKILVGSNLQKYEKEKLLNDLNVI